MSAVEDDARPGRAERADEIGGVFDQPRIDAGQIGRRRVAADRLEEQAERGAADQQPEHAEDRDAEDDPGRDEADMADAEALEQAGW